MGRAILRLCPGLSHVRFCISSSFIKLPNAHQARQMHIFAPTDDLELFPAPAAPPSRISPARLPGASDASTLELIAALRDNHHKWHIFFNEKRFHNHASHHLLAIWALGANVQLIEAAYRHDIPMQRPVVEPPNPITDSTFNQHLGDERYFQAYEIYFEEKIAEKGTPEVIEEFIFSREANVDETNPMNRQPAMLARLLDGVIHPMIHIGYGLEFGLPGMIVEGLAEAAVHYGRTAPLVPPSLFEMTSVLDTLSPKVDIELALDEPPSHHTLPKQETHVFDILSRIMKDSRFDAPFDADQFFTDTLKQHSTTLVEYANSWSLDLEESHDMHRKVEELQWMNSLVYAVSGFNTGEKDFFSDFFLMHLVTSSLFLPAYMAYLTIPSQELLLRSYLTVSLAWWVSRRPRSFKLDIAKFMSSDTTSIERHTLHLRTPSWSLVPGRTGVNPWFSIVQEALLHPDDHLCKIQRAFVHYAELYGIKEPRNEEFAKTELKGAELLDGSLFIRAANLTAMRMGRDSKVWDGV